MHRRYLAGLLAVVAVVVLTPAQAAAQADDASLDGAADAVRPPGSAGDLVEQQRDHPMQRPEVLADRSELTAEELAALQQTVAEFRDNEQAGDLLGGPAVPAGAGQLHVQRLRRHHPATTTRSGWWSVSSTTARRSSSIRRTAAFPPLTPAAQQRAAERQAYVRDHPSDGPEDRTLGDRCLHFRRAAPGRRLQQLLPHPADRRQRHDSAGDGARGARHPAGRPAARRRRTSASGTAMPAAGGTATRWSSRRRTSRRRPATSRPASICGWSSGSRGSPRTRSGTR